MFSEFRFVRLCDKRIARSQLCVGNVSQAKLMFRTRKRETTWVYAGEFKLRLSSLTWARPSQTAFAFIDSGRIAPASNETKRCAKRRCGTMSPPINVINMMLPINSYFYFGWATRGKRYFYLGIICITFRVEKYIYNTEIFTLLGWIIDRLVMIRIYILLFFIILRLEYIYIYVFV